MVKLPNIKQIPIHIAEVSSVHISDMTQEEVKSYLSDRAANLLLHNQDFDGVIFSSDLKGVYDFGFCYARNLNLD